MRIRLQLNLQSARNFVQELNSKDKNNLWHLENEDGSQIVNARSLLGTVWATQDWETIYLVNDTSPGEYCDFIKKYFYFK